MIKIVAWFIMMLVAAAVATSLAWPIAVLFGHDPSWQGMYPKAFAVMVVIDLIGRLISLGKEI